jgi:hypothetical protein
VVLALRDPERLLEGVMLRLTVLVPEADGLGVLLVLGATPSTCTLSIAGPQALGSCDVIWITWFAAVAVNVMVPLTQPIVVQPHVAGFVKVYVPLRVESTYTENCFEVGDPHAKLPLYQNVSVQIVPIGVVDMARLIVPAADPDRSKLCPPSCALQ